MCFYAGLHSTDYGNKLRRWQERKLNAAWRLLVHIY